MHTTIAYTLSAFLLLLYAWLVFFKLVRRDYRQRGSLSPLVVVLQALVFFSWGGFPSIYLGRDWPTIHVGALQAAAGWLLLGGGLAFMIAGMLVLGVERSFGRRQDALRQAGFYRFSRNPQVLACGLYAFGFALLWPSWYALGWALMYVPLAHWMVVVEEEHLCRIYEQEYERYCQRVPRYLGFR